MKKKNTFFEIIINLIAGLLAAVFLLPLLWMLIVSLKPKGNNALNIAEWFKWSDFTLDSYVYVLTNSHMLRWIINSFVIAGITTILGLFLYSLAAYSFSKLSFSMKAPLLVIIATGLLVPIEAIIIPLYSTVLKLNLVDNMWGVIFPGVINPIGIFIFKQFIDKIPDDYIEAADIEGSSKFRIWWQIILPLTRSAMVSVGIFYFLLSWNNFIWPYIALNSSKKMVLPTGIPTFLSSNVLIMNTVMAASALAAIPAIIVFLLLQKQIIKGISVSGIKG